MPHKPERVALGDADFDRDAAAYTLAEVARYGRAAAFSSKICPSAADARAAEARDRGRSTVAWIEPRIAPGNLGWAIACSA